MKYLVEVETVIGGEIITAGTIIENPENVVVGMVRIEEDAPKAEPKKDEKPAKKSKKEPKVEEVIVEEEILTEDSAEVIVSEEE